MKYLKVWTSFREVIEPLSDAEKGRLFVMMMVYAESFAEPADFAGNERFIWPAAKQLIDLTYSENLRLSENGKKGGRPKTKQNQDKPNETNENQPEPNKSHKEKESNRKKSNEKENNPFFDRFWSAYPRKVAKPAAIKQFKAIDPDEETLQKMLSAIEKGKRSEQWQKDGGQFIPYPATWLHQRRWEDQTQAVPVKVLPAHDFEQRDYSDVQGQMMDDLDAEISAFRKGAG